MDKENIVWDWEKNYISKTLTNFKYYSVFFKENFKKISTENDLKTDYSKYLEIMDSFSKNCFDSQQYNEHDIFFNEYLSKYENKRLNFIDQKLVNDLYKKIECEKISSENSNSIKIKNEVSLIEKISSLENKYFVPIKKKNYREIIEWMSHNPYISQNEFDLINKIHKKILYESLAFYTPFSICSALLITLTMIKIKVRSFTKIFGVNCIFSTLSVIFTYNFLTSTLLIKNLKNEPLLLAFFYKSYL